MYKHRQGSQETLCKEKYDVQLILPTKAALEEHGSYQAGHIWGQMLLRYCASNQLRMDQDWGGSVRAILDKSI